MSVVKCPNCGEQLYIEEINNFYKCNNNHSFDVAKQGYVNLLISNKNKDLHHGDSKEMLDARKAILWNGYYKAISDALNKRVKSFSKDQFSILDAGSGIGYYLIELRKFLGIKFDYNGIDISKKGIIESAKIEKNIHWVVGSTAKLPYMDESIDVIISVFSPITLTEVERVLKPGGKFIVISPNENHLLELKEKVYEVVLSRNYEQNELISEILTKSFSENILDEVTFKKDDLKNLLLMTPHYWRSSVESKEKLYSLESLKVNIDVKLIEYTKDQ